MYYLLYTKKAKTTLPTPILTKSVSAFEEPKKATHNENLAVQKSYDEISIENKKLEENQPYINEPSLGQSI